MTDFSTTEFGIKCIELKLIQIWLDDEWKKKFRYCYIKEKVTTLVAT